MIMNINEISKFLYNRIKQDKPVAFICRVCRFGVLLPFVLKRWFDYQIMIKNRIYDYVLQNIQGSKMYLDLNDKGLSTDLLLNGIREPFMTKAIQSILNKDDICLDIGANIGYYVLQEAKLSKKVYAIEPVKENYDVLIKNIKVNSYSNTFTYKMACGDVCKGDYINISSKHNLSSMINVNSRDVIRKDMVQVVTVDKFIIDKETPTFIRMDVEGYEYEIIKGMTDLLESGCQLKIFIELHLDILKGKAIELCKILKRYGFEISIASIEPHPAIMKHNNVIEFIKKLEGKIGAQTGYFKLSINDIINNPIFYKGQVEFIEVLFERNSNGR